MASSKCNSKRQKRYNPRKYGKPHEMADRLAERFKIIGDTNAPISRDAVNTIELQMRTALDAMTSGQGLVEHAAVLAGEVSKGMLLCQADFAGSGEYLGLVLQARDALEAAGNRALRVMRWALSGPELCTLRDFVELRVAQLAHEDCTKGIERSVHDAVLHEIRSGNAIRFTEARTGAGA